MQLPSRSASVGYGRMSYPEILPKMSCRRYAKEALFLIQTIRM